MKLSIVVEELAMARPVVVSRGAYATAEVVVVYLADSEMNIGRGECCPISHYGHSPASVVALLQSLDGSLEGLDRRKLQAVLPPGPARNALDCAMWDLEAKRSGRSVWDIAGLSRPERQQTAFTIVMADPADMAAEARRLTEYHSLKLKLGSKDAANAMLAVRAARPDVQLAIDVNEGWSLAELVGMTDALAEAQVIMVEQPLPARSDDALKTLQFPVPLCADESFHSLADLARVSERYSVVNIKLDKCGGLTEALDIIAEAPKFGLSCMVGCMFATSLAIAPALVAAASGVQFADLDGPIHLAEDRFGGFRREGGEWLPASSEVWG